MSAVLRLWSPATDDRSTGLRVTPRHTLREFFELWFLPIVLLAQKKASEKTIRAYREALVWWETLTGNPAISMIDDYHLADFQTGLRSATYCRGKLESAKRYPVKPFTADKHRRNIRALLWRLGPTEDRKRKGTQLLPEPIVLPHESLPEATPGPRFSIATARALFQAADEMTGPKLLAPCTPRKWWRAALWLLYSTGWRSQRTVLELRWSHVVEEDGCQWLDIPSDLVPKTEKARKKLFHPKAFEACLGIRRSSDKLLPLSHGYSWFYHQHERLQQIAGIPADKWNPPQAWRRTHSQELAMAGLAFGQEVARVALDHSNVSTTNSHYLKLEPEIIRKLPDLEIGSERPDRDQRLLF